MRDNKTFCPTTFSCYDEVVTSKKDITAIDPYYHLHVHILEDAVS